MTLLSSESYEMSGETLHGNSYGNFMVIFGWKCQEL